MKLRRIKLRRAKKCANFMGHPVVRFIQAEPALCCSSGGWFRVYL